ncbi:hypothetical protein IV102_25745 [bacterium]|nr:hypothetical protein [bacterium]
MLQVVSLCKQRGLIVVPVTYPAVPLDQPRIRLTVTSSHRPDDLSWAAQTLGYACREVGA